MPIEPNEGPGRLEDMSISANALVPPADTPIVVAVATGFDEFYRTNYEPVATALAISLGGQDLGREAADEAMTRAYGKWRTISRYDNPAGWVYKVGLNWGRSWHRKVASRAAIMRSQAPTQVAQTPPSADLALHEAMTKLDIKYRSVVVCRYLLDWSTEQTADALGLPAGTVKSRLSTALTQLRAALDDSTPPQTRPQTPQQASSPESAGK